VISAKKNGFSMATQRILVASQICVREGKDGLKLHNLRTDHVTIRSQLRYLIGAKIADLKCRVFGGNPLQLSGSGLEPDPEPNLEFGPVAKTIHSNKLHYAVHNWSFTWSVVAIHSCIILHKYACNVLLI
jgi:hypothetical protein